MLVARLLAWLVLPFSICIELLVVGILLLWFSRRQRLGKILVTTGVGLLILFSFGPVGSLLVEPLESTHPPATDPVVSDGTVRWVVVLGAGYRPDPALPATARVPESAIVRLAEGVRVYRLARGSRLLVLIGGADPTDGRVETVGEVVRTFGVPVADLVVDATGRTTAEEADVIRARVGTDRFVLVTSAFHMPRAVRLCRDRGLDPIPAPTGHVNSKSEYATLAALPSEDHLSRTHIAFSEALARLWRSIGG
jgi:uncharacterized SAM-binding protein YcdF (DUF218 family)